MKFTNISNITEVRVWKISMFIPMPLPCYAFKDKTCHRKQSIIDDSIVHYYNIEFIAQSKNYISQCPNPFRMRARITASNPLTNP